MKRREKLKLIKEARAKVKKLSDKRDKVYDRLLVNLGYMHGSSMDPEKLADENGLFDYIYNGGKAKDLSL